MASSKVASLAATAGSGGPAASALLGVGTKVSSAPASAPDERRCGAGWNGGGGGDVCASRFGRNPLTLKVGYSLVLLTRNRPPAFDCLLRNSRGLGKQSFWFS